MTWRAALVFVSAPGVADATLCTSYAQGWSCPANRGCDGQCEGDWYGWMAAVNLFRCMHDVPFVTWSNPIHENTKETFKDQPVLVATKAFELPPPLGPSSESAYLSHLHTRPIDAVRFWYQDTILCGENDTSCEGEEDEERLATAQFTSLIWQGVKEIGCATNVHNLAVCRMRDGKAGFTCTTPNTFGAYDRNVYPKTRSVEYCKAQLQKCGLPVPDFDMQPWEYQKQPWEGGAVPSTASAGTAAFPQMPPPPVAATTTPAPASVADPGRAGDASFPVLPGRLWSLTDDLPVQRPNIVPAVMAAAAAASAVVAAAATLVARGWTTVPEEAAEE